jgi:hypothetical protein
MGCLSIILSNLPALKSNGIGYGVGLRTTAEYRPSESVSNLQPSIHEYLLIEVKRR